MSSAIVLALCGMVICFVTNVTTKTGPAIVPGPPDASPDSEIVISTGNASYSSFDENVTILCRVRTRQFSEIHWYRDDDAACTPTSVWCHQENTIIDKNKDYISKLHLLNLSSNHTYTCKMDEMKVSAFIRVGTKPEILQLAVIPEEPQARSRQVQIACRFRSKTSPIFHRIEEQGGPVYEAPLTKLTDQEYRIDVTIKPILKQSLFFCRVSNPYGSTERNISVHVGDTRN